MSDNIHKLFARERENLRAPMPDSLRAQLTPKREPLRLWLPSAVAAAVALVVGVGLGRVSVPTQDSFIPQEVVEGHVRSLMERHLYDVESTDQHTVKPWFEGRLDFGADVKNFAEFPLIGGRLDYIGNRTAAALVFKHGQHVINVYEWPSASPGDEKPKFLTRRGYQIYAWRKAGIEYWAVSDLNAVDLQKFVELW